MRIKPHLILTIAFCLTFLCAHAQESAPRQIYNLAEKEYEIGRVEQAVKLLEDNLNYFEGNLKQSAYRLLSLCYLSEDKEEEALYYAEKLIKLNNYYNSTEDPARFQDLINQLKEGITTTITTASSQSETINEAPVPITIITAEMIEELGYNKNLNQILAAYVPGMAEVTSADEGLNMSMHGAYANGQELILIMENGHRLNTRFDNSGPTSYSISTEKIDHIEVLRGPASSLYGNVALSAVVNIITKNGRSLDGVKAKYGHATYHTHKADLTMGTQFLDADIFAWASLYNSDGQIRHISDGEGYLKDYFDINNRSFGDGTGFFNPDLIYVDGYKDHPAYDVGLTFRLKGFDFMFSKKQVKKVMMHTISNGGYDYDKYYPINGIKPGYSTGSTHAEVGYSLQYRKLFLHALVYSDWYTLSNYEVDYDLLVRKVPVFDDNNDYKVDENGNYIYEKEVEAGSSLYFQNKERTIGGLVRASTDYQLGDMRGSILMGSQYEKFRLHSRYYIWLSDFGEIVGGHVAYDDILKAGNEKILSFFIQDKHYFLPQLILNAGLRYDLKYRVEEEDVRAFSPRLSLLYVPSERFSLKLSYAEAYADLSFYNRYLTKTEYSSSSPQHLSALQLTAMGTIPSLHISYEGNIFYNKYDHLLCWQDREEYIGGNIGRLTNIGLDATASYAYKRLSANLTLHYIHDINSKNYYYNTKEKMVCGIPHFTINLHGAWKVLQHKAHELKVYGHSTYIGKRLNFGLDEKDDFFVDGKCLFDLGVKYKYKQRLRLSLDCENIFNTDHYICGPNYQYCPHIQKGRTLMASISYQL